MQPSTATPTVDRPTDATETLVRRVMHDGREIQDQPLVFGATAKGRFVRLDGDDGRPVSTCAILERRAVTAAGSFGLGLIGSVVTDPGARGQGHARAVLEAAERELSDAGCPIAMLWADDPAFYEHLGWLPAGCEIDYVIHPESALLFPDPDGVRDATAADRDAIHELYLAHPERLERTREESHALLDTPDMRVVVCERDGVAIAYACLGRGGDLQQVVHEWGGETEPLLACLRFLLEDRGPEADPLWLMAPATRTTLVRTLEMMRTPGAVGVLGMAKVIDRDAACAMLAAVCPEGVTCAVEGEATVVTGPSGRIELGDRELLLVLMPPKANAEVIEVVEHTIGAPIEALPFGPFVWGLDSI